MATKKIAVRRKAAKAKPSAALRQVIRDLMIANRILGNEQVVDAFGHVSVRHPERPDRYLLACSRSPILVTEDDIMEFDLDSNPIDQRGRAMYHERFIHGTILKARSDLMSACHNHAHSLIPFSVTGTPIRSVGVPTASIGSEVPIWDIRDHFADDGELMVTNNEVGRSLQQALGNRNACLMRGHGVVVATDDLRATVLTSIALMVNAELLMNSHLLTLATGRGKIKYMTDKEVEKQVTTLKHPVGRNRSWEYFARRAGFKTDVNQKTPANVPLAK